MVMMVNIVPLMQGCVADTQARAGSSSRERRLMDEGSEV